LAALAQRGRRVRSARRSDHDRAAVVRTRRAGAHRCAAAARRCPRWPPPSRRSPLTAQVGWPSSPSL